MIRTRPNRFTMKLEKHRDFWRMKKHICRRTSQVNQNPKKPGLNNKRSLKARIKALIMEQNNNKQSKYQRTYSIHHLEPNDDDPDWNHPILILPGTPNKGSKTLQDKEEEISVREKSYVPRKQLNKDTDSLELFLKFLQGAEISKRKIGLTKSGSFPLYDSKRGDYKPLKLKDKQKEVWSKVERLEDDNQEPNLAIPKNAKDLLDSLGLMGDEEDNRTLNRASTLDFRCKTTEQKEEDKQVAEIDGKNDESQETAGNGIPKSSFLHRRSTSLNDSLGKYSRLYDHSFGKEVELKPSRSLKVTNERVIPSIPFRRIRSLSVESSCFLQLELLGSAPFSDHAVRTAEESSSMNVTSEGEGDEKPESKEKTASLDAQEEPGDQSEQAGSNDGFLIADTDDEVSPDMEELAQEIDQLKLLIRGDSYREQGVKCSEETCFQEDYQISKGSEGTISNQAKEKDSAINSSDSFCTDSEMDEKAYNKHSQSYKTEMDDPDLCFVMAILECSGFTENFFQGTWYSSEQPLNPSVFEEVESCWEQEFQSSREEICMFFHHQMLFDLINEVLTQIYDTSFTYYPAALSSCTRIRPLPTGKHIIAEVCSTITSLLNLKPEAKQSLESIVARDLEKDYGWMNLQTESEFVALEVEGILFEDLLDEILNP
ncbi:PREDICTED: protein TRM32-like isoform X2 [Ipomoea nil]|uniref:protein TRM32-like isoform X2 n=1 Tax=Ipomoea nil TaxID=35883 RepID=UPI000901B5B8|nr:PREDICTED: protein TRM32-like isoform X2 [Ipomoea nil]